MTEVLVVLAIGFGGGVLAGMFGVGGGIVFVPALVFLGLTQVEAEATSLLAILPTAATAAWRQRRYGNLRLRPAFVVGAASVPGVLAGVALATSLPEDVLRRLFALFLLAVALHLVWRARRESAIL